MRALCGLMCLFPTGLKKLFVFSDLLSVALWDSQLWNDCRTSTSIYHMKTAANRSPDRSRSPEKQLWVSQLQQFDKHSVFLSGFSLLIAVISSLRQKLVISLFHTSAWARPHVSETDSHIRGGAEIPYSTSLWFKNHFTFTWTFTSSSLVSYILLMRSFCRYLVTHIGVKLDMWSIKIS